MSAKEPRFHNAVSKILNSRLGDVVSKEKSLNRATCIEIYTMIFDTIVEIMQGSKVQQLDNDCVNYVAQQYYDCIQVNGNQELDPNIFDKRVKLDEISTQNLVFMAMLLTGTDMALPLIHEVKRRS